MATHRRAERHWYDVVVELHDGAPLVFRKFIYPHVVKVIMRGMMVDPKVKAVQFTAAGTGRTVRQVRGRRLVGGIN